MDVLLALKGLAGFVLVCSGIVVGSFVAAIWLRLAAQWLQIAKVPYLSAFKSALISNFVVFMINFSIAANYGLTATILSQSSERNTRTVDFAFAFSPIFFVYVTIFGLFVTAAIFGRTIPSKESESRISLSDSLALASLYFAIGFASLLLLGLIAFCIVSGLLAGMGV